jgi:hypothetical protein
MRDAVQLERLLRWRSYGDLFGALRRDTQINVHAFGKDYIENSWYHTPDAECYASMIADWRPGLVVEVGGGFSTFIARKTIDELSLGSTRLIVIDPEPRADVHAAVDVLMPSRVEEIAADALPLGEPILLFIDSSHVTRTGGDVAYLYNQVVPNLAGGSLVHVHDIFIPFDYRSDYQARRYTEQYVVHALLTRSANLLVEFACVYMSWRHPDEMRATFGETVPGRHGGASLWFAVA